MADFNQLKADVANQIKTNGVEAITGAVMQDVLLTIINSIADGYMFGGVAQHSGDVGNPDYNVFYLGGSGSYTGYGESPLNVPDGCYCVMTYNGTWHQYVVDLGVHLTGEVAEGETQGVTGDKINTALNTLFTTITNILDSLEFVYNTPAAQQGTKAMLDATVTLNGVPRVLATLVLGAATAEAAGLLSAEDKAKLDAILANIRSMVIVDTTESEDEGGELTETLKWTVDGAEEVICAFTILAATAEKAGLLSAADKQKLDAILGNLRSLEIDDTTAYADLGTKIVESIKATIGGQEETISTFQILAATAEKAGLLSAADKAKLDALWSSGYQFVGIATPSTTPVSTTAKIFYIATQAGTYTRFDGIELTNGINILMYDGSAWSSVNVLGIDPTPTVASENLTSSGGIRLYVDECTSRAENNDFKTYIGKPIFTHGRIETDVEIGDGYTVITPINDNIIHSQIIPNVIAVIKNNANVAILEYDNDGNYTTFYASSTIDISFNCANVRIQAASSQEELLSGIEVICKSESSLIDKIEDINRNNIQWLQGGFNNGGYPINEPNKVHSNIIENVKIVTPLEGYQVAILLYNLDGTLDTSLWSWHSDPVLISQNFKKIRINLRKSDLSFINASSVGSAVSLEYYDFDDEVAEKLVFYGYNRRNVAASKGSINQGWDIASISENRLHTGFIDNCIGVFATNGYEVALMALDNDGNSLTDYFVWKEKHLFEKEYRIRCNIRKADNSDISDISNAIENVFFYTSTKSIQKKISILGDSLSTFGTATAEHTDPQDNYGGVWTYPQNLCRYPQNDLFMDVDYCWFKKLIDNFGLILGINESWRATTVTNRRPNHTISSQERIDHLDDNGNPDIIFIFAGTNDIGEHVEVGTFNTENPTSYTDEQIAELPVDTFANAYRTMIIRCMKKYTTSKFIVIMPDFTTSYYTPTMLDPYIEIIREECDYFGIPTIDLRTAGITIYNKTSYLPDGIHFGKIGADMLYRKLYDYLQNNYI